MHRAIAVVLFLLASLLPTPASAQCIAFGGPCTGGASIFCTTRPAIGTRWQVCPQTPCTTGLSFLLMGDCDPVGIPIASPPACFICPACTLHVNPITTAIGAGFSCVAIDIPSEPRIVGATFCVQSVCFLSAQPACLCLSNALQVTVMP